jgi:murein L,D-transpeptidase YafK
MKGIKVLAVFLAFLFLSLNVSFGKSLEEVVRELGGFSSPEQIEKALKSLNSTEKLKLEVLLSAYKGNVVKARKLLKLLHQNKEGRLVIANTIYFPPNEHVIVVDKKREILYVIGLRGGIPFVEEKFPCITGKRKGDKLREGDQRTPEGIYFPLYWSDNLPPIYGIGAFPLNYPNLIDRKILHRDGHGIWIHGTDNPDRPPHSSNGCIVLKNKYLKRLLTVVKPKKTPVIIVEDLQFSSPKELLKERASLLDFINHWKKAWENTPKSLIPYLKCYSKHFVWNGGNLRDWKRYKERVTLHKRWIKLKISDIFLSKDGRVLKFGNLYVASFKMIYNSNNFHSVGEKVLYVIKEGGKWKILGEGNL